jgi:hypothetical protein
MFGRTGKRVVDLQARVEKLHGVLATNWARVSKLERGTDDGTRQLVARVDRLEQVLRTTLGVEVKHPGDES